MNLKQNYESGRSMTEMLGVLAVIGVLSIGGIAGYNYAMNKHHANQVLQDIRLVYQELKYPNIVRQIVSEGSFPDTELDLQSPYEYDFDFENPDNFNYDSTSEKTPNLISVNVLGVSKTACDILLKTKPEYVLMLKANGESTWNCTQDENKLSYIFEITTDKLEYRTCSVCTGDHCFDDDSNCPEGETCQNDRCAPCSKDQTQQTDGVCYPCNDIHMRSYWHKELVSRDICLRCDNTTWISYHNRCQNCDEIHTWEAKKEECDICSQINSNVVFMGVDENHGACSNCNKLGSNKLTLESQCKKCPGTVWYPKKETDTTGLCTTCDCNAKPAADFKTCECNAENHYWAFVDWVPQWGVCDPCSSGTTRYAPKSECDKCAQRYFSGTNERFGECALCPEGQIKSADGKSCVDA